MNHILKAIYNGQLNPSETIVLHDRRYLVAVYQVNALGFYNLFRLLGKYIFLNEDVLCRFDAISYFF
jgi:hypothetical protein